jgi:hypothetical protein
MVCTIHTEFFDDSCEMCRQEYLEMKRAGGPVPAREYKKLTEERAKKLFEEILLQYLKSGAGDTEAAGRAKAVVRRQCDIRGMPYWPWL